MSESYKHLPAVTLSDEIIEESLGGVKSVRVVGDLNIVDTDDSGFIYNIYDEESAVPASVETTIVSFLPANVNKVHKLQRIEFSGTNIAQYFVYVNSIKIASKRTHHGSGLSGVFEFGGAAQEGIFVEIGHNIELKVIHERGSTGDFEGRIQYFQTDA